MTILIGGDSWGSGVWSAETKSEHPILVSPGLSKFIKDSGNSVINVSSPADSNMIALKNVWNFLYCNSDIKIKKIIIFQTDWCRDFYMNSILNGANTHPYQFLFNINLPQIVHANTYRDFILSRFYLTLSQMAKKYDVTFFLVGGLSDVLIGDNLQNLYPGVVCACQSAVSLALTGNDQVSCPTTGYTTLINHSSIVSHIKQNLNNVDDIYLLLKEVSLGQDRLKQFEQNKTIFPDSMHGGESLHYDVFKLLKNKQII